MNKDPEHERQMLKRRLSLIGHKILVLSGKGGVGKSTVAVNIATALAAAGKNVGILDIDIHGPSIPKLLNIESHAVKTEGDSIIPVQVNERLKAMSIGLVLQDGDAAVIWRGPMKTGVIKQFLKDVVWGELDYLIVDSPPGTGDEPLSVCQLIENPDGAVIVTTPQELAIADVRRCVSFCRSLKVPILGVIENMSGFVCPQCGHRSEIFKSKGGEHMAAEMGLPFAGSIPMDPDVAEAGDSGNPFLGNCDDTDTARAFTEAIGPILNMGQK